MGTTSGRGCAAKAGGVIVVELRALSDFVEGANLRMWTYMVTFGLICLILGRLL
jgi:hypothetical protein